MGLLPDSVAVPKVDYSELSSVFVLLLLLLLLLSLTADGGSTCNLCKKQPETVESIIDQYCSAEFGLYINFEAIIAVLQIFHTLT